jgi:hypothetical protein
MFIGQNPHQTKILFVGISEADSFYKAIVHTYGANFSHVNVLLGTDALVHCAMALTHQTPFDFLFIGELNRSSDTTRLSTLDTIRAIRALQYYKDIPAVCVTRECRGKQGGFNAWISTHSSLDEKESMITSLYGKSQKQKHQRWQIYKRVM